LRVDFDRLNPAEFIETSKSTNTHIPIVAMTAHAMEADRERCLAAGMDAYLPKPIHAQQLVEVIESVVPPTSREGLMKPVPTEGLEKKPPEVAFDLNAALARVEGDRELLKEIATFFIDDSPRLLLAIRELIAQRDSKGLELAAHTLKGTVSNFNAQAAFAAALQLENIGRSGDLANAEAAYIALEQESARLQGALAVIANENRGPR
jgi:CheY-like chemotaxis protein